MQDLLRGKLFLAALYIGIVLTIGLRVSVEVTQYCSPDSNFYLKVAENVLTGKGLVRPNNYPFSKSTGDVYFAVWPAGYPLTIAALSLVTNLPVLVSSKLVNLLFLGFTFILLYKKLGKFAWFPALYFCSFGLLEVYSYTWSEGPFLFFVLALAFMLNQDMERFTVPKGQFLSLFFCLVGLFLFRYAGLLYFFLVGGFLVFFLLKKEYKKALQYFIALALASLFVLGYLLHNFYQTGFYTGGSRYFPEQESFIYFLSLLLKGLANQFFLARNYYFYQYSDPLFVILLALQLTVCGVLLNFRKWLSKPVFDRKAKLLFLTGLFYLAGVIILRKLSPFDKFDYRILAPFSTPLFIGLFYTFTRHSEFFRKAKFWVTLFMVLSLLMNLPKHFILEKVASWF